MKGRHFKLSLFTVLLLTFYFNGHTQQYSFIQYSLKEGLPQSQVFAHLQDSKGYLWFGTRGGGISQFDGINFKNYSSKDGLSSNYINAIFEDSLHQIWVGTDKGLNLFKKKSIESFSGTGFPKEHVLAITQVSDSTSWLGTTKGIYELNFVSHTSEKIELHPRLDRLGINQILKNQQGIWIASNGGLWHITESIKWYSKNDGLNGSVVQQLKEDKSGNIWMVSFDGGISIFQSHEGKFVPFSNIPEVEKALSIHIDQNDKIWCGTLNRGICIYSPKDSSWTRITDQQGLPHNHVRSIFEDHWNNKWICTSGGGVARFIGPNFINYNKTNALHGNYIYALETDKNDDLWISASNKGLAKYNGTTFQKITADSGYLNVKSKTILSAQDNSVWVGTEGKGILRLDSSGRTILTEKQGLPSNWIRSLVQDENGIIWAGTHSKGLFKIEKVDSISYNFKHFDKRMGIPDLYVSCLSLSPENRIWFGTQFNKVGYLEEGKISRVFGKGDGLPSAPIRAIEFDTTGNVWVATAGKGIYHLNMKSDSLIFEPLEVAQGLFSDNLYLLVYDGKGNLWAGSENGVDKISVNQAGYAKSLQHFGRNEGFLGIETCQNSGLVDAQGNLWFGTINGLMKHVPGQNEKSEVNPKLHFQNIALFYKPLQETSFQSYINLEGSLKEGLKLPYNQNHLSFDFRALDFENPNSVKYRWRLLGNENNWSPLSAKNSVDYSNLPPGNYHFEAQAISGRNKLSNVIFAKFTITQPYWATSWFKVSIGAILCLLILFMAYRYKRLIEKREAEKLKKLELENHLLLLEQKALQLQMNPHFIFNALNGIQAVVASKDHKTARSQINKFASLMRGILSNSKQKTISLEEEINVLKKYLEMEQFCQSVPFEYTLNTDNISNIDEIEIPPMILQPFVENAVIHGISHLKSSGKIDLDFSLNGKVLTCSIEDNGVGRKRANALRQTSKPGHQSMAMEVTRQRLDTIKGKLDYSPLTITDILSDSGDVIGTKVIVKLLVEINY